MSFQDGWLPYHIDANRSKMFKDNTFSILGTQIIKYLEADKARNQEIAADTMRYCWKIISWLELSFITQNKQLSFADETV